MSESPVAYIPTDRRHALVAGADLPGRTTGAALFADISGFTPLTEALVKALGTQRGTEELPVHLNRIYDALVAQVDNHRGSVLTFSGDAITCWFDESGNGGWTDAASGARPSPEQRATSCAIAIQTIMQQFAQIDFPGVGVVALAVKVAVAAGPVVRFLVGEPSIQIIDVMAGETLQRLARAEHLAERGDVVIDEATVNALDEAHNVVEWRVDHETDERFAVVRSIDVQITPDPWPELPADVLSPEEVRPWLSPPVAQRLFAGKGEFLTELRPLVSMFVRFAGIDYDEDVDARSHLDTFVRAVENILDPYESYLLQITIGDKGSYFHTCFGAPIAHGDDVIRAALAAIELAALRVPVVRDLQIGVAQGRARTGAYGGVTRRTYGVLGDDVNLSARLMQAAHPDEVLVDENVRKAAGDAFVWEAIAPLQLKGKSRPTQAYRLIGPAERETLGIRVPDYGLPMVGRRAELAQVLDLLDRASGGRGQVLGVTGEAGMGKSRLVAEVMRAARAHDMVIFGGECQSFGVNASYLLWQNVFRSLFGLDHNDPVADQIDAIERQLTEINPLLVERLPLLSVVLNIPIADNELTATFDASLRKVSLEALLVEFVRYCARETPMVFVLEDVHWIDPLSRDLLRVLSRVAADLPLIMILAYRPADLALRTSFQVNSLAHFTEVVLSDLPDEDIASLVEAKLRQLYGDDVEADQDLVAELSVRAQGNPFYIEEILNFLDDRGVDPRSRNPLAQVALPDSLYSLILGRIDHLTEDQKTAIKVASVIGRLFYAAMLTGVYPPFAEREGLENDLDILADLELTVLEAPDPELSYLFKHVLTQEVAYETLSFATRAMLHDQIGQYIERGNPDLVEQQVDVLAHHYDRSENQAKRREYLRKAGEAAQSAGANLSAISYYERVLPLVAGEERVEVLLQLAQVQELVGDWAVAEALMRDGLSVSSGIEDRQVGVHGEARSRHALGVLERKRGQYVAALELLEQARASFNAIDNASGASRVTAEIGELYRLQGRYTESLQLYADSLAMAERITDHVTGQAARAHALKGSGVVATWQGDYEAARKFYDESMAIRRELSDKPGVAVLLNNQAVIARFLQDLDAARRLNDESLLLLREVGDQWAVGQLLNNQACVASDQGDYGQARVLLNESLSIRRQLGDRVGLALSLTTLADVVIDEGDFAAAVPILDESLAINRELGDNTMIAYVVEDYAAVAAASGRSEQALRLGGFASALRSAIGAPLPPSEQERVERLLAPAKAAVDTVTTEACWAEGQQFAAAVDLDSLLAL